MKRLLVTILLPILCALASCKGRPANTGKETLQLNQLPVAIASDFETRSGEVGLTLDLFGVKQKVDAFNLDALPVGKVLVYCSDERFIQRIGHHFSDMGDPKAYVGSTMFISFDVTGVPIELRRVAADHHTEKAFSGKIMVAYFEVGEKGNLINIVPKD